MNVQVEILLEAYSMLKNPSRHCPELPLVVQPGEGDMKGQEAENESKVMWLNEMWMLPEWGRIPDSSLGPCS